MTNSALHQAEHQLAMRNCTAALRAFHQAERCGTEPDRCDAGRWMANMLLGAYEDAWQASDRIRSRAGHDPHRFWNGEPLAGKRVMLRCLHGYGDTVQYLRWLPQLRALAGQVTVQAAPEMLPLLACLPDAGQVLSWTVPGESDQHLWNVQIECAELPYTFRATPATLPSPTRLAFPEVALHTLRTRMGPRSRPRIGLVWHGSDFDPARSIPFELLRQTVLHNHDVEFWSLQPPSLNAPWLAICAERGWNNRTFYTGADSGSGIADMAAFASQLDLVLTIDTLAAHIAGSIGLPTWLLLKHDADWRWMLDRDDTPWYPTTTLFRQPTPGDWLTVLKRVCDRLRDWNEERPA